MDVVTQRQGDERYTALARNYVNYQSRLESLISGGSPSDFRKAEELLNSFYREQAIRQVFPNLEEYSSRIMEGRIEAAEEQAKEEVFSAARKYAGEDELVLRGNRKNQGSCTEGVRLFRDPVITCHWDASIPANISTQPARDLGSRTSPISSHPPRAAKAPSRLSRIAAWEGGAFFWATTCRV